MAAATRTKPSFEDLWRALKDVPEGFTGEIVDGEVRTHPRPAAPHAEASSRLGYLLGPPFELGFGGGSGGWVIIDEPRVRFGEECRVPDLAGWRKERYARPEKSGPYEVVPDWICELVSKSTVAEDRTAKLPLYAKHGVKHAWILDPVAHTLEVFCLENKLWVLAQTFHGAVSVRAEPFDAIEIDLGVLWGPSSEENVVDEDE